MKKYLLVSLLVLFAVSYSHDVEFVCYDFHSTYPDMSIWKTPGTNLNVLSPGAVAWYLDEDRRPVFANKTEPGFPFTNYENFFRWYRSFPGINDVVPVSIPFNHAGDRFFYNNNAFFPLDNRGFGNEGEPHNYYFTCRAHFYFEYYPNCTWSLSSDDDLWVFVNGVLVADLGGLHVAGNSLTFLPTSAIQTAVTNALGEPLIVGNTYRVDIFFAERQVTESALNIDICHGTVTPPPSPPPIPSPKASGDPHIYGFLGQKFDFHGEPNKIFNIISDDDLQVNAKIVDADLAPSFKKKTYFGSFGIKAGKNKLFIACDRALNDQQKQKFNGGHALELNGISLTDTVNSNFNLNGVKIQINNKRTRVTVDNGIYKLKIHFSSSARSSCHINLRASTVGSPNTNKVYNDKLGLYKEYEPTHLCPHGVLGQTVRPTPNTISDGRNGEGVIEGIYTSYLLPGEDVFGDKFDFNCFDPSNNVLIGRGTGDEDEVIELENESDE